MGEYMTTKIIGTGSAVPEQVVTNDDLSKVVDSVKDWNPGKKDRFCRIRNLSYGGSCG
jgi:3-oxoacyl-[acyl-carrier-protein] synthase III